MLITAALGISLVTASFSGPSQPLNPVALELGGYVPVSMASPAEANPGETITVNVTIAQPHSNAVTLNVSTDSPSMIASIPATMTVPAGSNTGSFQVTFASSALGYVQVAATDAAGTLTSEIDVVSDIRRNGLHLWF